jgi:hypothetical protein
MNHPRDESPVPSAPIQGARRFVVRGKESVESVAHLVVADFVVKERAAGSPRSMAA